MVHFSLFGHQPRGDVSILQVKLIKLKHPFEVVSGVLDIQLIPVVETL